MDWTYHTIKSISKAGLCVLINEKGFVLKKKYHVSLLKPCSYKSDSDTSGEINEKDQESDSGRQQKTVSKNLFDKLADEILEMILMNVTKSYAIDAFCSISRKRFKLIIEGKKDEILPMVYINVPEIFFPKFTKRSQQNKSECEEIIKTVWFLQ